jgi:uncharacterized protein YndB with AHSA1/START domain
MSKPEYINEIAIACSPEEVWAGLTSPEFTKQYWHRTEVQSDFSVGSPIRFMLESGEVGCEGEILIANYPFELAFTWRFPNNPETEGEAPSRVTFRLEPIPAGTKLTMIHDHFPVDSKMLGMVREGWPLVLGGLKTLLESGRAVDFSASAEAEQPIAQ